jgi:prepilin-type N-terminal cleavage/methylation domain-containing protein
MQNLFSNPMDNVAGTAGTLWVVPSAMRWLVRRATARGACLLQNPSTPPGRNGRARGFTLVELLVAVTILAILASLFLAALYTAQDQARTIKTRATIAKLHNIMMQRYDSYKTRRVPINVRLLAVTSDPKYTQVVAKYRLDALRELMRLEMPDRLSDVVDLSSPSGPVPQTTSVPVPSVTQGYRRRLLRAFAAHGNPSSTVPYKNQSAELLYMIVTSAMADDEGQAENFGASEVADTDNNGLPEFVDAWGTPIQWIRWPAGFISELQPVDPTTGNRDIAANPDPFDPRGVYRQGGMDMIPSYAIYPLIYSAGPDKIYDIVGNRDLDDATNPPFYADPAMNNNPFVSPDMTDVGLAEDRNSDQVGPGNGEANWLDNIHNHLIGQR